MKPITLLLCGHTPRGQEQLSQTGIRDTWKAAQKLARLVPAHKEASIVILTPTAPPMVQTAEIIRETLRLPHEGSIEGFDSGLLPSENPRDIGILAQYIKRNLEEHHFICVTHPDCLNNVAPALAALYGGNSHEDPPTLRAGHVMVINEEGYKIH